MFIMFFQYLKNIKFIDLNLNLFRLEMNVNSAHIEKLEKMDEEFEPEEEITDLDLEVKIEESDENRYIKTEVSDEINNSEQIIGEKRKNKEKPNLENENKRVKEKFVLFEEIDDKQEPQEIKEINNDDLNNQVVQIKKPLTR
jgi:flagellar biosynthesis GTPase FlhF